VKRQGLDLTNFGKVDLKQARQQRLSADSNACPVSIKMVDEYEAALKSFWLSVHEHTQDGAVEMGEWYCVQDLDRCTLLG